MPVRVASAAESSALDRAAIAGGIPSRALMRVAAANAATVIAARCADRLAHGVTVFTGPGNNGGDGWAVAGALAAAGVRVSVEEAAEARSEDAGAERAAALPRVERHGAPGGVVIDALLGTGSTGDPRDAIADAVHTIAARRDDGAFVVALDVPTGLDSTTGARATSCVVADLTITFGTAKRGVLVSRATCGEVVVVDIGLPADDAALPRLVDATFVRDRVPPIAADAHKGTRKSLAIVAGARTMGGAAIDAAEGALRSGAGLVKVVTDAVNIPAVHARLPEALTAPFESAIDATCDWADAVVIGPGLGHDDGARALVRSVLERWRGPVVLDADALNVFDGDLDALAALLERRDAVITPHPAEFARLVGREVRDVLAARFDIGADLARTLDSTVLLKGTPTVVTGPDGSRCVVAAGTAALATGGSGDVLSGMIGTLVAQGIAPTDAAACAAWVHGRAAELVATVRGSLLQDVVARLADAWRLDDAPPPYPVLLGLPSLA
jgi:NAD(P)H-hydrate epimerase